MKKVIVCALLSVGILGFTASYAQDAKASDKKADKKEMKASDKKADKKEMKASDKKADKKEMKASDKK